MRIAEKTQKPAKLVEGSILELLAGFSKQDDKLLQPELRTLNFEL
jgi:hypothetical protein